MDKKATTKSEKQTEDRKATEPGKLLGRLAKYANLELIPSEGRAWELSIESRKDEF